MGKAPISKILDVVCRVTCNTTCEKCFRNPSLCDEYAKNSRISIAISRCDVLTPSGSVQMSFFDKTKTLDGEIVENAAVLSRALLFACRDLLSLRTDVGLLHTSDVVKVQNDYVKWAKRTLI